MNPPEKRTPIVARVVLGLVSAVALVAVVWAFVALRWLHGLLSLYTAILLAPLLYCFCRRGAALWRDGFRRAPKSEGWRLYGWTLLVFVSLTVLFYSLELWRGKRAYANLQREVEAQGGSLELKAVIPPPVPDDQNFCATPLLAAMMDYDSAVPPVMEERIRWRDPTALQRIEALRLPELKREETGHRRTSRAPSSSWLRAERIDLAAWQRTFASHTNFPASNPPRSPAEDVVTALSKFDQDFAELHAASQRPAARWALHYQDGWFSVLGLEARFQHLRSMAYVLKLRAVAAVSAGRSEGALQDVKLMWRLADSMKEEPYFSAHYFRNELLLLSLQPVWEGLAARAWSDGQLAEMQARLDPYDALASWQTAVRGETFQLMSLCRQVGDIFSWKTIRTRYRELMPDAAIVGYVAAWLLYPSGWTYQDQVYLYRFCERELAASRLAEHSVSSHRGLTRAEIPVDPFAMIFVLPKLREMFKDQSYFEFVRSSLQQARLACALERHRLAQGDFPATLDALVPRFLDKLPLAPDGNGLLLGYRRTADGQFLLHPAGMTNVSERFEKKNARHTRYHRLGNTDGVWRYPTK
ncbi:MAG: hypothetical protein HZA90_07395 [Verrucomicrobia bacterium]|nr:hypothetical protein [Verrucomicrobiota bacterium]